MTMLNQLTVLEVFCVTPRHDASAREASDRHEATPMLAHVSCKASACISCIQGSGVGPTHGAAAAPCVGKPLHCPQDQGVPYQDAGETRKAPSSHWMCSRAYLQLQPASNCALSLETLRSIGSTCFISACRTGAVTGRSRKCSWWVIVGIIFVAT